MVESQTSYAMSDLVLSGFLRVVTNQRVFDPPMPIERARIFDRLCRQSEARGNIVPGAYLAALAIESGSEWITTDRDHSRFPELRWRHPLG